MHHGAQCPLQLEQLIVFADKPVRTGLHAQPGEMTAALPCVHQQLQRRVAQLQAANQIEAAEAADRQFKHDQLRGVSTRVQQRILAVIDLGHHLVPQALHDLANSQTQ
ncbi:hypothetical protein D3C81_2035330 [compost metagenome]